MHRLNIWSDRLSTWYWSLEPETQAALGMAQVLFGAALIAAGIVFYPIAAPTGLGWLAAGVWWGPMSDLFF